MGTSVSRPSRSYTTTSYFSMGSQRPKTTLSPAGTQLTFDSEVAVRSGSSKGKLLWESQWAIEFSFSSAVVVPYQHSNFSCHSLLMELSLIKFSFLTNHYFQLHREYFAVFVMFMIINLDVISLILGLSVAYLGGMLVMGISAIVLSTRGSLSPMMLHSMSLLPILMNMCPLMLFKIPRVFLKSHMMYLRRMVFLWYLLKVFLLSLLSQCKIE